MTRYKNPPLVAQHCFVASFRRCFPFFTLRDQPVAQQKHLLRGEESCCEKGAGLLWATNFGFVARFSSNSQLVGQQICSSPSKSTNQSAAFLQPATNAFVAGQIDHARWENAKQDQNLQRNNECSATSWGFWYLVFRRLKISIFLAPPPHFKFKDKLSPYLSAYYKHYSYQTALQRLLWTVRSMQPW